MNLECFTSEQESYNFYVELSKFVKAGQLRVYPNNCPSELIAMAIACEQIAKEMRLTASMRQYCADERALFSD